MSFLERKKVLVRVRWKTKNPWAVSSDQHYDNSWTFQTPARARKKIKALQSNYSNVVPGSIEVDVSEPVKFYTVNPLDWGVKPVQEKPSVPKNPIEATQIVSGTLMIGDLKIPMAGSMKVTKLSATGKPIQGSHIQYTYYDEIPPAPKKTEHYPAPKMGDTTYEFKTSKPVPWDSLESNPLQDIKDVQEKLKKANVAPKMNWPKFAEGGVVPSIPKADIDWVDKPQIHHWDGIKSAGHSFKEMKEILESANKKMSKLVPPELDHVDIHVDTGPKHYNEVIDYAKKDAKFNSAIYKKFLNKYKS